MRHFKNYLAFSATILFIVVLPASAADNIKKIIGPGDAFPDLLFQYELSPKDREFLGLNQGIFGFLKKKSFTVQDIPADIVVVEFFNNYCTSCQAQAPVLNTVFAQVMADQNLKGTVKFIGIGAGNNAREVERFRTEKSVPFPLIPDADFAFYNAIGDPGGTPFTIMVKKSGSAAIVVSTHKGLVRDPSYFISSLRDGLSGRIASTQKEKVQEPDTRMLTLAEPEGVLLDKARQGMLRSCAGCAEVRGPALITLHSGEKIYRGEAMIGDKNRVLYSKVISRKPACDVCHGAHFIITFDASGIITDFTPLHVTKYGNVAWQESDIQFMKSRLVGRSIKKPSPFDPAADAVTAATMSSSLIINSVNNLGPVFEELSQQTK